MLDSIKREANRTQYSNPILKDCTQHLQHSSVPIPLGLKTIMLMITVKVKGKSSSCQGKKYFQLLFEFILCFIFFLFNYILNKVCKTMLASGRLLSFTHGALD